MILQVFGEFMKERQSHFQKMMPLSVTFMIYLFGWGLILPVFNIRINEITDSVFLSGIIFSVLGLVMMFIDPNAGRLCDKINPKKILQLSLIAYSLIFFLYTLCFDFFTLLIVRVIHAVACSFLWISGWTLARKKSKGKYSQEELGFWTMTQNTSYVIAPIIGGILISIMSYNPMFYAASILSFIAFIYASLTIKAPRSYGDFSENSFKTQVKMFFSNRFALRLSILTFILVFVTISFTNFLPIHMNNFNIGIEQISVVIGIAGTMPFIIFPATIGVFSDKYGKKIPTLIGLLLISFSLLCFTIVERFTEFVLFTFLLNTGSAIVFSSVNAELNDILKSKNAGSYTGIFEMVKDSAVAIGPFIGGMIISLLGMNNLFLSLSVLIISSTLILKGFKRY